MTSEPALVLPFPLEECAVRELPAAAEVVGIRIAGQMREIAAIGECVVDGAAAEPRRIAQIEARGRDVVVSRIAGRGSRPDLCLIGARGAVIEIEVEDPSSRCRTDCRYSWRIVLCQRPCIVARQRRRILNR